MMKKKHRIYLFTINNPPQSKATQKTEININHTIRRRNFRKVPLDNIRNSQVGHLLHGEKKIKVIGGLGDDLPQDDGLYGEVAYSFDGFFVEEAPG